jgi:glucokinase
MNNKVVAGIDIGGTKCAVCLGDTANGRARLLDKRRFTTPATPLLALKQIEEALTELLEANSNLELAAIGVSCGGPLNSRHGIVLSPPNLPGWDEVDVLSPLKKRFGVPAALQNDANAGALAEWRWGSGRGTQSMIFLTFGTGMGAGLILDGKLYSGTNDMAGEVGHIRLEHEGPVGYGKAGSFEGFCSGGGIAQLARTQAELAIERGTAPSWCRTHDNLLSITAESVGLAARQGDKLALDIFQTVAHQLGRGLAILVDILNPELIVLGSIYGHQRSLLEPLALKTLQAEALPLSLSVCRIVPAALGEANGDLAALAVAFQ